MTAPGAAVPGVDLALRPLELDDLPLLAAWRTRPHVREWWDDAGDLDALVAKYAPRITGEAPTDVFLVLLAGEPIGWIQRYRIADHDDWARTIAAIPAPIETAHAAGIDYAIGESDHVGRGVGSAMIATFTSRLFDDWPDVERIVVTPQQANIASCRALEKAGYELVWTGLLESEDPSDAGTAAVYLLRRA